MVAKKSKRITSRKYMGDDAYSWAVFLDGQPAYTGLSQGQRRHYTALLETQLKEADAALESKDTEQNA